MKNTKKKGFTIVELVIVIAVIGILSAILIPTFSNLVKNANSAKEQADLRNAYTEYASYAANTETFYGQEDVVLVKGAYDAEGTKYYVYSNGKYTEGTKADVKTKTVTVQDQQVSQPVQFTFESGTVSEFNGYTAYQHA